MLSIVLSSIFALIGLILVFYLLNHFAYKKAKLATKQAKELGFNVENDKLLLKEIASKIKNKDFKKAIFVIEKMNDRLNSLPSGYDDYKRQMAVELSNLYSKIPEDNVKKEDRKKEVNNK